MDQIYRKRYFLSKTEKVNIIFESPIFKLVLEPNSNLNWQFFSFYKKKDFSGLKQKKWTPHIFYITVHIQISWNFSSNWQFLVFGPNLPRKVFPVKNWKSQHHWIPHIQFSLGTKFQLTFLFFLTRFAQKAFFWSKIKKVNTTYFLHNSGYSN